MGMRPRTCGQVVVGFDSVECLRFAAQADVVCTNPPFSLLGQYLPLMVEHARHVLVLGNMNAVKYRVCKISG